MSAAGLKERKEPAGSHTGKTESIDRILAHPSFQNSESLSSLLRYLAKHALDNTGETVKEHQIATEVFRRSEDFDPRIDSIVRVHISRLRSKLDDYYESGAGNRDAWRVQLPRGTHALTFVPATPAAPVAPPRKFVIDKKRLRPLAIAGIACALFVAGWFGHVWFSRVPAANAAPDVVRKFWNMALPRPEPPLMVFSNAEFIGRPETGIRYPQPGEKAAETTDGYTGVGEVFAVHALNAVFAQLRRGFELRRAQRLNWDEARDRDIVFIGSPAENLPVRDVQLERFFAFRVSPGPERRGDLAIVNLHPRPGEQQMYFGSPQPISDDYAVIVLAPGNKASQRLVLLAGTTTYGTEAAAEFVTDPQSLSNLFSRLDSTQKFQRLSVLVHTKVKGGVPLQTDIVSVRTE